MRKYVCLLLLTLSLQQWLRKKELRFAAVDATEKPNNNETEECEPMVGAEQELCHCPRPDNGMVEGYWRNDGSLICARCEHPLVLDDEEKFWMINRAECDPPPEYSKETRTASEIAKNPRLFGNFLMICEHCDTYSWLKGEKSGADHLIKHMRESIGVFCPKCSKLNYISKEWRVMLK